MDISKAAPILCAGVTTYSPLKQWKVGPGDRVGVVGIGGLGHMAVQLAKAMGAEVTAITKSEDKQDAVLELGADHVLISTDKDQMKQYEGKLNYILCTIPEAFDVNPYVELLYRNGSLVTVGLLGPYEKPVNNMQVAMKNRTVGGSIIGGVAETQEVIDFCAEHQILPHVQMISMEDINDAFKKIKDETVRFRYVVDMKSLHTAS
ncbi:zinc-binding dehydrogenase [Dyadobacter sp. CY323]|uniref:zinc-binding dehydrogenase n=1 Tax=Dyadobacter sp. CY323 TaxID=2907302 RepID=UPI001F215032|nr:zinc-binding dehydrogenase [Dyadobacter sp. CY323]MCE6991504.1 zinc-binding dehydrogenase [Dyadobacter sp. CY323]